MKEYLTYKKEIELQGQRIVSMMAIGGKLMIATSDTIYMAEIQQPSKFKRFIKWLFRIY